MKRPQGFDQSKPPAPAVKSPTSQKAAAPGGGRASRPPQAQQTVRSAAAQMRAAQRQRKRFERNEVKRFTRRSRVRRRIVFTAMLAVASLFVVVGVAVFSPLLAVETIEVRGADRLQVTDVQEALSAQIGVPLALVDGADVEHSLEPFALIQSYSTEAQPPHTLVVSIIERRPIGVVSDGSRFAVVDPAGIVIGSESSRPQNLPEIVAGEASTANRAFESVVAVLQALPADLRSRVDVITATTEDDVEFSLSGGTQSVRWGSVDRAAYKARVFAALVASQKKSAAVDYDVSSPDAPVVRKR